MPKRVFEYLFYTDSAEQVQSLLDDYLTQERSEYAFYLNYMKQATTYDMDTYESRYRDCWYIHADNIEKALGEINLFSIPLGCRVRFSCYEDKNIEKFTAVMDEITTTATILGFNPKIYGELPELVDEGDIQAVDPEQKQIEKTIQNTTKMKCYYKGYNPKNAIKIFDSIPQAWDNYNMLGERWGPGYIAKVCNFTAATVGRYCTAFKLAGITTIEINGEEIPIP